MDLGARDDPDGVRGRGSIGLVGHGDDDAAHFDELLHGYEELLVLQVLVDVAEILVHRVQLEHALVVLRPGIRQPPDLYLQSLSLCSAGLSKYVSGAADVDEGPIAFFCGSSGAVEALLLPICCDPEAVLLHDYSVCDCNSVFAVC